MKKISVGILTYNHEVFIEKCLKSVLNLTYSNLEIIISDDASQDATSDVINNLISSIDTQHTIIFNRNENNLGLAGNFNRTFYELATGDYLITLGGDDIIKKDYISSALDYFEMDDSLMMCDFDADTINEVDDIIGVSRTLQFDQQMFSLQSYLEAHPISSFAPGRMIRKDLITYFKPLDNECPTEDSVLVLRALLLGKLLRINNKVILYRRHSSNISSLENLKLMSNVRIVSQYLSDVLHMYKKGGLNERKFLLLLRRLDYEVKQRDILYSSISFSRKRIKLRIAKLLFKITNRI